MTTGDTVPVIRPIQPADDPAMADIIRGVMTEFGADGPGFSIHDAEVDRMHEAYSGDRAAFFVVDLGGRVIGGAGVAPLDGGEAHVCELKKMYFLPEARGRGLGRAMLDQCLDAARGIGFRLCYLESLERMTAARRLYERAGFRPIDRAMGCTGHSSCDRWYVIDL